MFKNLLAFIGEKAEYGEELELNAALSALRGPDVDNRFTRELRALVGDRIRFAVLGNVDDSEYSSESSPLPKGSVKKLKALLEDAGDAIPLHYQRHLAAAVLATSDHAVWNRQASGIADTLNDAAYDRDGGKGDMLD